MAISFLPTIVRIGTQLGPILLNELNKPRTKDFIRKSIEGFAESRIKQGAIARKGPLRKPREFIMRRGRQRFRCRKVN